jgi:thiol-disulfide isomerase/thioredoxin
MNTRGKNRGVQLKDTNLVMEEVVSKSNSRGVGEDGGEGEGESDNTVARKTIITAFRDRNEFTHFLSQNQAMIIIRFSATWCNPCQKIKPLVDCFFASSPPCVTCVDLDVDENSDVYSFLKSKKMIYGIPTLLCYTSLNKTYIPGLSISGSSPADLDRFFRSCGNAATKYMNTFQQRQKENFTIL